ncbi:MAG: hypothetical protein HC893_07620 [Chloroflexaceae bacterium]|nr:hypothetical protein [Chloroflexaceae bacterium]
MPVPRPDPTACPTPDTHKFFFKDVGPYNSPGRLTPDIIANLQPYRNIVGVRGGINQLQTADDNVHMRGMAWQQPILMGRKFEMERVLFYAMKGQLQSVNSTAATFDITPINMGTIRFIEVKWSQGPMPAATIDDVSREAKTHPTNTYLVESNWIDDRARQRLIQKGGVELP